MSPLDPPIHLSPSARELWASVVHRYELELHHHRLLQLLCEAWDRAQMAREQLAREGLTVPGREGGIRPHPAVSIERDARLGVARLLRELDLDVSAPVPERAGPPALPSNRGRRHRRQPKIRRPTFDAETVELFRRLEALPAKDRAPFTRAARELARKLGLTDEFWTANSPLDRSSGPHHPPECVAYHDFHRCRRIRRALLEAIAASEEPHGALEQPQEAHQVTTVIT